MTELIFLQSLGLMVVAAAVVVLATRVLRVPTIVAYLVTGLVLGPLLGVIEVTSAIDTIAEVGIALLLFLVGLELSLDTIRGVGKVAVVAGVGQVIFTAIGGYGLSILLGFTPAESLFLGLALTFSSTVVVVKLLTEKGDLGTLYGGIAVGIFLVQDLVVVVILTFLAGLGGAAELDIAMMGIGVGAAFGGMAVMLAVTLLAARFVLPSLFAWISSSLEALFIWSLCWCFLLVVAAEVLGLSVEIGALVAGVSLAQLPYAHELRREVRPLMNFFIAVFFTALAVRMDLSAAGDLWLPAVVLSLFVLIGNPLVFLWIIARFGYTQRTAFMTSVTVAQISEFSFIFAAMGLSTGLIDESVLSVIALVGVVTIAVSSYMILYNDWLYDRLKATPALRIFRASADVEAEPAGRPARLRDHVIVVGLNSLGLRIVEELWGRGENVVAIDTDPRKLVRLPCGTILGNVEHPSVLEEANLAEAKLLVSALRIEDTNNMLAYRCRRAGVPCSIHAFNRSVVDELREIGANHLMIPRNNGIRRVTEELRERGMLQA